MLGLISRHGQYDNAKKSMRYLRKSWCRKFAISVYVRYFFNFKGVIKLSYVKLSKGRSHE
jgi:hypothetical protein